MDETAQMRFANIIIDISHEKVDRPFGYIIPRGLRDSLEVGMSVKVPFGKGDTVRTGIVTEITEQPSFDPQKMKEIIEISTDESGTDSILVRLAAWIRRQYGGTMITALKTVIPAKVKTKTLEKKEIIRLVTGEQARLLEEECLRKHQVAKARVLHELVTEERIPRELLTGKLHVATATINSLIRQEVIREEIYEYRRDPIKASADKSVGVMLSDKQAAIVRHITADLDGGVHGTYLIHGITGSGKTEVYMELIADCIRRGKAAIVLIPEIALTYQTVMRFYRRFGNRVSVMNSTLSAGEKYDQCERAKNGEIDVIIGPRSALFTPFPHLGLIIIDEEHEASYKSETTPKYHAREVAIQLAKLHGASVVLGSATPSLESYYRALNGQYHLFELTERLTGNTLPHVTIADMREELRSGNRSVLSRQLQDLVADRLRKGEQTMLFLNRRGYAGFISCRNCGEVIKCPHCDVSLSEHRGGRLVCHYCGYEAPAVKICPKCGSKYIRGFRAGTQQIEEKLHEMYPQARILRMDADTTRTKDSYEQILSTFASGEADILLGTQMIVKGHDFPNVTLVGALVADMSLFANDYRASERTFQLLTQAAGRAGRGAVPGEVVIQTYQPDHYSIQMSASQDYKAFYEEEILYRDLGGYPPVQHLMAVLTLGRSEAEVMEIAKRLTTLSDLPVIGPSAATIAKINDIYRVVFYIKCNDEQKLYDLREAMEREIATLQLREIQVNFDFDPMSSY